MRAVPMHAGTNRAELGAVASRIFAKGGKASGTKDGMHVRRKLIAGNNAGKVKEGGKTGKIRGAFRNQS